MMSYREDSKYENLHILIFIDEPFNFHLPKRGNKIGGIIVKKMTGEDNQGDYWLVKVDKPFTWKGAKVSYLTVASRYQEESLENILKDDDVTVGIGRVLDESILGGNDFTFKQVDYFAIGRVEKRT